MIINCTIRTGRITLKMTFSMDKGNHIGRNPNYQRALQEVVKDIFIKTYRKITYFIPTLYQTGT